MLFSIVNNNVWQHCKRFGIVSFIIMSDSLDLVFVRLLY